MMTIDPVVVERSAPLAECAARMVRLRVRHLPVVGPAGLTGVLTDAAVFQRGAFLGEPDAHTQASSFVTYDSSDEGLTAGDLAVVSAVTGHPDDPLEPLVRRLASSPQDQAMVVDGNNHPVGIFTEHDGTRLALAVLPPELTVDHLGEQRLLTGPAGGSAAGVLQEMNNRGIRHALVVDATGELTGVVSQRDLVMDDVLRRRQVPLGDVVRSSVVFTVAVGTALVACAEKMLAEGVGCLPIVRNGQPIGIVTRRDLVEAVATALESEKLFGG